MIRETTKERMIAFIRNVANDCSNCVKRDETLCRGCRSRWASSIMQDVEIDQRKNESEEIDYSLFARETEIKRILSESGRPLLAKEIDLKHTCSPQLKFWTLNHMIEKKMISRKFAFKSKSESKKKMFFLYYMNKKETK